MHHFKIKIIYPRFEHGKIGLAVILRTFLSLFATFYACLH